MMTDKEISPAACAVLDAALNASSWGPEDCLNDAREIAVAVLRAVAEQTVVPLPKTPSEYDIAQYDGRVEVIENLLAIADEL
jgi:hypothetical protein